MGSGITTVSSPAIGSSLGVRCNRERRMVARNSPARISLISCVLELAARSNAGQHNLRIFHTVRLYQRIKRGRILGRDAHAAVRDGFTEILHLIAAMNGMTVLHKENGVRHRGVVPLLAIPNFVHRGGSISSGWRRISCSTSWYRPVVFFYPI